MCEGHRSRSPYQIIVILKDLEWCIWPVALRSKVMWVKVKGHVGQGQMRIPKKGRWLTPRQVASFIISNVSCRHLELELWRMMTMIFTPEMSCLDMTSHWTPQRKIDYTGGLLHSTEVYYLISIMSVFCEFIEYCGFFVWWSFKNIFLNLIDFDGIPRESIN